MPNHFNVVKEILKSMPNREIKIWVEDEDDIFNFVIFTSNDLEKEQYGYSLMESGESLTNLRPGDWQKSWIVIGYNEELGDPLFIDTSDLHLPVYTAIHGTGIWRPILLFKKFEELKKASKTVI